MQLDEAKTVLTILREYVRELSPRLSEQEAKRFVFARLLSELPELRSFLGIDLRSCHEAQSAFARLDQLLMTDFFSHLLPADPLAEWQNTSLPRISLCLLAYLYERFLTPHSIKQEGIFYTPLAVVNRMVQEALGEFRDSSTVHTRAKVRILDPACGSGIFLLQALHFLTEDLAPASAESMRISLIQNSLFGVDKDPHAIAMSRLLLSLAGFEGSQLPLFWDSAQLANSHVCVGNSLLEPTDIRTMQTELVAQLKPFSWNDNFPEVLASGGFNFVIGNPPYGLSRNDQLSPEENEALKRVYRRHRRGKVNKYLLFMAKGYELLAPTGCLSFVVPNAWLGIKSGMLLRKLFVEDQSLDKLTIFRCKVFEEPSVEAVVFKVKKNAARHEITVQHSSSLRGEAGEVCFKLPYDVCRSTEDYRIPVEWSDDIRGVLDHIRAQSMLLGDPSSPVTSYIALQAYSVGKGVPPQSEADVQQHIFHSREKKDESYYPYLEGSDIQPFSVRWSGSFLRYGEWLAEPQTLDRFSKPRVVIREILSPRPYLLNAAFITGTMLYNKSVIHIVGKLGVEESYLAALAALLNSKVASFIMLACGRKSQRSLFPKIVNEDLLDFPIPLNFARFVPQLAPIRARSVELDRILFEAYRLRNSHVKVIEQFLAP